jgi:molybdopterin-binding protein
MEESIRNQIPGTVKSIVSDKVISEIVVETNIGEIASIITTRSVQKMNLMPGDKVLAVIKSTNVSLRRA